MKKVKEIDAGALPQAFLDVLPKTCEACGADTEITETLTMLVCSNRRCPEKACQRLVALLKDLGVKNMGDSKCQQFLTAHNTVNPYSILLYNPATDGPLYPGCSIEFSESIYEQINGVRSMLLWEFVKIGNLPGIRDSARHLFINYADLEEFYDDLEGGGVAFVQSALSIKGDSNQASVGIDDDDDATSVKAVDVYNTLVFYKDELLESVKGVDLISVNKIMNICISTAVGAPYKSKQDFVAQMNARFSDKVHLNFLGSVTKDCEYVVWSKEGAPTSKVKKAEKYGIPVLTGAEFEAMLQSM